MSDLVSKSVLQALIMDKYPHRDTDGIRDGILNIIARAPRAEKRQTGKWENLDDIGGSICSNCSYCFDQELLYVNNFCPNCGADMRGESK